MDNDCSFRDGSPIFYHTGVPSHCTFLIDWIHVSPNGPCSIAAGCSLGLAQSEVYCSKNIRAPLCTEELVQGNLS